MKITSILMIAVACVAFLAPAADAAPRKSKKAKIENIETVDEFDVDFSSDSTSKARTKSKGKKRQGKAARKGEEEVMTAEEFEAEEARRAAEEAEAYAKRSGAERREEARFMREEAKHYLKQQKETLTILRKVRNEKSAAAAVKPMEKLYGAVDEDSAVNGAVTAMGTVKILEEDEEKLPIHQSSRAQAAALNQAINKEMARISKLNIQHKKFNAVLQLMIDAQR